MRQLPWKYHTKLHGPVFAYAMSRIAGHALAVTWEDMEVVCSHNELLEFDPEAEGAQAIIDLDDDITEMRFPNTDDRSLKWSPPQKSKIGAHLLRETRLFSDAFEGDL